MHVDIRNPERVEKTAYYLNVLKQRPDLLKTLAPRLNKYIPNTPTFKQTAFLALDSILEGFYGGAASGGKSDALLTAALGYVDVPGYAALLLRRTFRELSLPSALLDRARQWLTNTDARWIPSKMMWQFPAGSSLTFGYLQHEGDVYQYDSAEFQFIGFDELTQFTESQYRFMFSRLRKKKGMPCPLRIRGASNPGGVGHLWVKDRLVKGADIRKHRFFIPARREDNPYVDQESYERSLEVLDEITKLQRKFGDWDAENKGGMFKRHWFCKFLDAAPVDARRVRFWDLAASNEKGDYTVGTKVAMDEDDRIIVEDVVRGQWGPHQVEKIVKQTAELDGPDVTIAIEQEPGASGKIVIDSFIRLLNGYDVQTSSPTGNKVSRWRPFAAQSEAGNVWLLSRPWNSAWIDELTNVPNAKHDDQADSVSGAYNKCVANPIVHYGVSFLRG